MSRRELTATLSRDLSITKYTGESDKEFASRLTYTALGLWARFLASIPDNSGKPIGNVSKSAHHRKLVEYLHRFLSVYDDIEGYFQDDDPIALIRSPLFASMDLHEVGFDSRITAGKPSKLSLDDTHALLIGITQIPPRSCSSGLAFLAPMIADSSPENFLAHWNIPQHSAESFLNEAIKTAKWEEAKALRDYEFFDVNRQGILSSCWAQFLNLSEHPCVARKKLAYGRPEYYLVKQEAETIWISSFSEFAQNEVIRETQRVLYAMKARSRSKVVVNVDVYQNYSIWHFWSRLPPQEERLLRYIGWPKNNITNRTSEFVIRNEFNSIASLIANNLGIIKKETRYE